MIVTLQIACAPKYGTKIAKPDLKIEILVNAYYYADKTINLCGLVANLHYDLMRRAHVLRNIYLYTNNLDDEQQNQLARALSHFDDAQGTLRLITKGTCSLPLSNKRINVANAMAGANSPKPFVIITGLPLDDNWFSHAKESCGLITLSEWEVAFRSGTENTLDAAPDANILTSLALTTLLILGNLTDWEILHPEMTGCLFDLCAHKPQRVFKMRSGYVCRRCIDQLAKAGVSSVEIDAINSVLDRVRHLVLGRTPQTSVPPASDDELFLKKFASQTPIQLPARLVDACRTGSMSVLVGSGLSMQHDVAVTYRSALGWKRLPSWSEVPTRLAECLKRYRGRDQNPRVTETLDEFLADLDFFRDSLGENVYYPRAIFDIFTPSISNAGLANRLLFRLPARCLLTTNYDFVLQCAAPSGTPVYTWQEAVQARGYLDSGAKQRPIIKLHGCASRSNTVILTRVEYAGLVNRPEYVSLLHSLFEHHAMLFVGFGLNDPRDLDNILRQARLAGAAEGEKFALIPVDKCTEIAARFPQIQTISYANHADVPRILSSLLSKVQ